MQFAGRSDISQTIAVTSLVLALATTRAMGQETGVEGEEAMAVPTSGGKQLWGDVLWFRGWRVQQHVFTGRCRLLDEHDRRHAQGTYRECLDALNMVKQLQKLAPPRGRGVIVLHGLGRSRGSMQGLAQYLGREEQFVVINLSYPSTRGGIGSHAKRLDHVIRHLEGVEELNFVAHSMGNIVVRHYLADLNARGNPPGSHPPFGRMVMLGPPNHGAELAGRLGRYPPFGWVLGQAALELGPRFKDLEPRLATPGFEFGIIAGGRPRGRGGNPIVEGDNDWIVSVETTRLAGASDFLVLPLLHTFIMDDRSVQEATLRFLRFGYFVADDRRQPLGADPSASDVREPTGYSRGECPAESPIPKTP